MTRIKERTHRPHAPQLIHPIHPDDIKANAPINAFGKTEAAEAACAIVSFCQQSNGWWPFTLLDLYEVQQSLPEQSVWPIRHSLARLVDPWLDQRYYHDPATPLPQSHDFVRELESGSVIYQVTARFIDRCFLIAPTRTRYNIPTLSRVCARDVRPLLRSCRGDIRNLGKALYGYALSITEDRNESDTHKQEAERVKDLAAQMIQFSLT